ncbi:MAG: NBR1-Ig-like domain-containing protein [Anaerolineaceae bacterium]|nr:NBR1-Ig-like domain-containing protein [Anaerolineaceae bacterium]
MTKMKVLLCAILLGALLVGCGEQPDVEATSIALITQAVNTVQAQLTQTAAAKPTDTPTPEPTDTPTPTSTSAGTATSLPTVKPTTNNSGVVLCDMAGFVADVTIPDGTTITPGASYVKTWELRNDGTCTWNTSYLLVFYSGSQMSGPSTQQLTSGTVAPGQTIQISVNLVAPTTAGDYTGYWVLRNASGSNFGIGGAGNTFYVQIKVGSSISATPTVTTGFTATSTTAAATATTAPPATETPAPTETPTTESSGS